MMRSPTLWRMPAGLIPLLVMVLAGCASPPPRTAVPEAHVEAAAPPGFERVRFWGDEHVPDSYLHETRRLTTDGPVTGDAHFELNLLALSGGGENGAFGAGLLSGWTQEGSRPVFDLVTGVSTGALIAPFAFLGPAYDDRLEDAYTRRESGEIFQPALMRNLLRGESLGDVRPFAALINTYIDAPLIEAVAAEHAAGRRLFVITTNLDAGRPVVWDLGAIATRGGPAALELFRTVIMASAALPGAFPAVPIEVETAGGRFVELHADGGITSNVFAYQPQLDMGRILDELAPTVEANLYVIRNGLAAPSHAAPRRVWHSVAARSLGILLFSSAQKDITRIYHLAQRDGINFKLALIPETFTAKAEEPFDPAYMRELFALGETMGREGYPWRERPY